MFCNPAACIDPPIGGALSCSHGSAEVCHSIACLVALPVICVARFTQSGGPVRVHLLCAAVQRAGLSCRAARLSSRAVTRTPGSWRAPPRAGSSARSNYADCSCFSVVRTAYADRTILQQPGRGQWRLTSVAYGAGAIPACWRHRAGRRRWLNRRHRPAAFKSSRRSFTVPVALPL